MKLESKNGNAAYVRGSLIRSTTIDGDGEISIRFRGEESSRLVVTDTPENRRIIEEHLEALDRKGTMVHVRSGGDSVGPGCCCG